MRQLFIHVSFSYFSFFHTVTSWNIFFVRCYILQPSLFHYHHLSIPRSPIHHSILYSFVFPFLQSSVAFLLKKSSITSVVRYIISLLYSFVNPFLCSITSSRRPYRCFIISSVTYFISSFIRPLLRFFSQHSHSSFCIVFLVSSLIRPVYLCFFFLRFLQSLCVIPQSISFFTLF